MGAICCDSNPVENQVPSQLKVSSIMDINNEPVNDQSEPQFYSTDQENNSRFDSDGGFGKIIGGSMHESDGDETGQYKDFELVVEDDRNFILKHKKDLEPAVRISMREEEEGVQWTGLPDLFKEQLSAFRDEDVQIYPGTLLKTILDQFHFPR